MATLSIIFTSTSVPTNGYLVKYRQKGTSQYTELTVASSDGQIDIPGVGSGVSYEGTIQSICGNGQYGTAVSFAANAPAAFNMARDPSSYTTACASTNRNFTFYAATLVIQQGQQLYADSDLTTPFTTAGFYSDGTNAYQVNSAGIVLNVYQCNLP